MNCAVAVRFKNDGGQNRLRTRTGAQRAGAVRRRRNNRFAANLFRRVFARRVAEVKIAAAGLAGANFHAVAFAAEEDAGLFLANGQRFGNFGDRESTAFAPLCSAVTIVLVARSTSNTTHAVSRKSRFASAGSSAGERMASIFIYVA